MSNPQRSNPHGSTLNHRRTSSLPSKPDSNRRRSCNNNSNMSRHEGKQSHRSRRSRRSTQIQPDVIDRLDTTPGGYYHHEGPFDAASREKNMSKKRSPLYAVRGSTAEALKATPREKIVDSIQKQRPIDGVAFYPPGTTDRNGHTYDYEEGYNMMTEDRGNFRRWPGMKFRDEDFKHDPAYVLSLEAQESRKKRRWGLRPRKNTV
ncbi:hypothetical protein AJ80_05226 [Polytolypa hystricis UAMH7299]|uniref:Pal1 cell morphology protein n=1 Tax=Polytolypa hystricis (strain UAMH7299) TaxID=1447883 RepID=A0A2B7Y4G2_POLH7|nr:hypothetical protein AJ80_05226 [Polytolypa hystricis UAMH7299]